MRAAITRWAAGGNRVFERDRPPDPILSVGPPPPGPFRLGVPLRPARLAPPPADETGVHPPDPGVLGAVQGDPATDQLAREEPVAVQLHVDFGALAARTKSDGLGERADARAIIEHEDLGRPDGVEPQGDIESRTKDVLHARVSTRVRREGVERNLELERIPVRPRLNRLLPAHREAPLHDGRLRSIRDGRLPGAARDDRLLRAREVDVQSAARDLARL